MRMVILFILCRIVFLNTFIHRWSLFLAVIDIKRI